MTVPRGLRPSHERTEARRLLVEEATLTADGLRYVALLRQVADDHEFDLVAEQLAVQLAVRPDRLPHRRAKQAALARERARRRAAPGRHGRGGRDPGGPRLADPATGGAGVDG
jgi:hypothetical protein